MRDTRAVMGMPVTVEALGPQAATSIEAAYDYFRTVDERFSTYKPGSEISRINRGEIPEHAWSFAMREVFEIAERTKNETGGYFDIKRPDGFLDPSGIVKGWAIKNAARLLEERGERNFYIDAGGDIAAEGKNSSGESWSVGIRNPFAPAEIVKVVYPRGAGVATSGSYMRGDHIYDPLDPPRALEEIVSITVIGPDILDADRFATAAFAMQRNGIALIEQLGGFEGYMIDRNGTATMTSGFAAYTQKSV